PWNLEAFTSKAWSPAISSEERLQIRFEGIGVFEADHFLAEDSLTVKQHCSRQAEDAAKLVLQIIRRDSQGIVDPELFGELGGIFAVHHGVEFESDDGEPLRTVTVEKFLISRHLSLTRLAPSGPEIYKHHLAAEIRRRNRLTLQVVDRKIWQPRANLSRVNWG